jgi:hypothetical protein
MVERAFARGLSKLQSDKSSNPRGVTKHGTGRDAWFIIFVR